MPVTGREAASYELMVGSVCGVMEGFRQDCVSVIIESANDFHTLLTLTLILARFATDGEGVLNILSGISVRVVSVRGQ